MNASTPLLLLLSLNLLHLQADTIPTERSDIAATRAETIAAPETLDASVLVNPAEDGLYGKYLRLHERLQANVRQGSASLAAAQTAEAQHQSETGDETAAIVGSVRENPGDRKHTAGDNLADALWTTTGNVSPDQDLLYLGTLDRRPLLMMANGKLALRIYATPESPNLIGGFHENRAAPGAVGVHIGGGGTVLHPNLALSDYTSIGGGIGNRAGEDFRYLRSNFATIGGGQENQAARNYATIGGGQLNRAIGESATISGGQQNLAMAPSSVIGGGIRNAVNQRYGTVSGGSTNIVTAKSGTISGGEHNKITGSHGTIGGGLHNEANGKFSTVPGGSLNQANGTGSFAAGTAAHALHDGSFIWADKQDLSFASSADNQFLIRASGNVGIDTSSPREKLTVNGNIAPAKTHASSLGAPGLHWQELYLTQDLDVDKGLRVVREGNLLLQLDRDGNLSIPGSVQANTYLNSLGKPLQPGDTGARGSSLIVSNFLERTAEFSGDVAGTVDQLRLQPAAVTSAHLRTNSVHASHLKAGAVVSSHLKDGSVGLDDLNLEQLDTRYLRLRGGNITRRLSVPENEFIIGERQFVAARGKIGIGTAMPSSPLTVSGIIQSTVGGIKFPDGTIQTTAAKTERGNRLNLAALPALTINGPITSKSIGFTFPDGTTQTSAWNRATLEAGLAEMRQQQTANQAALETSLMALEQKIASSQTLEDQIDQVASDLNGLRLQLSMVPENWQTLSKSVGELKEALAQVQVATGKQAETTASTEAIVSLQNAHQQLKSDVRTYAIQIPALQESLRLQENRIMPRVETNSVLTRDLQRQIATLTEERKLWAIEIQKVLTGQASQVAALEERVEAIKIPELPEVQVVTNNVPEAFLAQVQATEAGLQALEDLVEQQAAQLLRKQEALGHRVDQLPRALEAFRAELRATKKMETRIAALENAPKAPVIVPQQPIKTEPAEDERVPGLQTELRKQTEILRDLTRQIKTLEAANNARGKALQHLETQLREQKLDPTELQEQWNESIREALSSHTVLPPEGEPVSDVPSTEEILKELNQQIAADRAAALNELRGEINQPTQPQIAPEAITALQRRIALLEQQPVQAPRDDEAEAANRRTADAIRILQEDLTLVADSVRIMQPLLPALKQDLDETAAGIAETKDSLTRQLNEFRTIIDQSREANDRANQTVSAHIAKTTDALDQLSNTLSTKAGQEQLTKALQEVRDANASSQAELSATLNRRIAGMEQTLNLIDERDSNTAAEIRTSLSELLALVEEKDKTAETRTSLQELNEALLTMQTAQEELQTRLTASVKKQEQTHRAHSLSAQQALDQAVTDLRNQVQAFDQKLSATLLEQITQQIDAETSIIRKQLADQTKTIAKLDGTKRLQAIGEEQKTIRDTSRKLEATISAQGEKLTELADRLQAFDQLRSQVEVLRLDLENVGAQLAGRKDWTESTIWTDFLKDWTAKAATIARMETSIEELYNRNQPTPFDKLKFGGDVAGTPETLRLQPGTVGTTTLLPNAVDSSRIRNGSIALEDLNSFSIDKRYATTTGAKFTGSVAIPRDGLQVGDLQLTTVNGMVGVGTDAPSQTLDVDGTLRIRGGNPAEGYVLRAKADGSAYWDDPNKVGTPKAWGSQGNSGTLPARDFLGTTDNTPLSLRVNNQTALRVYPNQGTANLVGGHGANQADKTKGVTIGGGGSGAEPHVASGDYAVIGGGLGNQADLLSTASGGYGNQARGQTAVVGGGYSNITAQAFTAIAGGANNRASGMAAAIGGGTANRADGEHATVPGGLQNQARGNFSFAAGKQASALHAGSFVWNDATDGPLTSSANHQVAMRASGGYVFQTGNTGQSGVQLPAGDHSWHYHLAPAQRRDARLVSDPQLLTKLKTLRVQEFQSGTDGKRHIAPDARSFNQTYGLSNQPDRLHAADIDGITLATLQALLQKLEVQDQKLKQQERELDAVRSEMQRLTRLLNER